MSDRVSNSIPDHPGPAVALGHRSSSRFVRGGLVFLAWTLVGAVALSRGVASPLVCDDIIVIFQSVWLWALFTPLVFAITSRIAKRFRGWQRGIAHGVASIGVATVDVALDAPILMLLGVPIQSTFVRMFFGQLVLNLLSYAALFGITQLLRVNRLSNALAQARLDALENRLRPHFVFNSLHTVAALVRAQRNDDAVKTITRLGELLRSVVAPPPGDRVRFQDELELVQSYLAIETIRFADRLQVEFLVSDEALDFEIPRLVLQPLVDNAVRHGVEPNPGPSRIAIEAGIADDRLCVQISNPAVNGAPSRGLGVAMTTIRERLDAIYDGRADFGLSLNAGLTVTSISFPRSRP